VRRLANRRAPLRSPVAPRRVTRLPLLTPAERASRRLRGALPAACRRAAKRPVHFLVAVAACGGGSESSAAQQRRHGGRACSSRRTARVRRGRGRARAWPRGAHAWRTQRLGIRQQAAGRRFAGVALQSAAAAAGAVAATQRRRPRRPRAGGAAEGERHGAGAADGAAEASRAAAAAV
jgi:hypothetical protein